MHATSSPSRQSLHARAPPSTISLDTIELHSIPGRSNLIAPRADALPPECPSAMWGARARTPSRRKSTDESRVLAPRSES